VRAIVAALRRLRNRSAISGIDYDFLPAGPFGIISVLVFERAWMRGNLGGDVYAQDLKTAGASRWLAAKVAEGATIN